MRIQKLLDIHHHTLCFKTGIPGQLFLHPSSMMSTSGLFRIMLSLTLALSLAVVSAQAAAQPMIDAFRSRFPLVPINITVELPKYADSIIDRSYVEGKPFVDVAFLQTVHDFPRWDKEQRLLHYKPPTSTISTRQLGTLTVPLFPLLTVRVIHPQKSFK